MTQNFTKKTKELILLIHNFLESDIEDAEKGIIYHDLASFLNTLNSGLLERLKNERIKQQQLIEQVADGQMTASAPFTPPSVRVSYWAVR